ncbi:uncharacterized protein LOC116293287 isoform X2 [Actinia tenebrosa]|uniref:Uncharacterized protein LOC116293287 isoform X2 n=1 Tax=Actinia tenebrosa TaxID=6105 RepID=A0A6P8HVD0_ACTTE|nr:uncharacterized protein LOC116293287 isoform X2 [Actinia tenebrosa]
MPESHTRPKSSYFRTSLKHELVRQDIDEKWKRVVMTPTGIKIIRIQPTINNDSLLKYQSRPGTSSSLRGSLSPRHTSTPTKGRTISPVPPSQSRPGTSTPKNNGRAMSASSMRSTGTQTSLEGTVPRTGLVLEKPPAPAVRPGSSRSTQSATYNSRSQSCQPPHMYMNDNLRRAAKHNRPASHVHSCGITEDLTNKQPTSPRRFDGTVVTLPKFVKGNEFLTHEDLSIGQKQYIWGIARIYSVSNMIQLKQRQYQSLLDYDFNRRIQNKDLKEHERKKEWREYIRYSKFIKRQDLRIPRAGRQQGSPATPCEEVSHIHRHVVKGWTTNPHSDAAYRHDKQERGREQKEEDEEAVRRLPDESDTETSSPDTMSGRYEVVLLKTPKDTSEDEKTSKQEEQISESADSPRNEEKDEDADVDKTGATSELLSEGEESNYL